jgi:molecular chaperone GrpE
LKIEPKADDEIDAGIPESAFEEALTAVEKIRSDVRAASKAQAQAPAAPRAPKPAPVAAVAPPPKAGGGLESDLQLLSQMLDAEYSVEKEVSFVKSPSAKDVEAAPEQQAADPVLAEKEKQIADLSARLTALQEEFEKFRQRLTKEAEAAKRFGNETLILKLLPILDNLERAIEHADSTEEKAAMIQGVRLVHKQLGDALTAAGAVPVEAKGRPFDPNVHEAITTVETDEVEPNLVMAEYLKGYLLFDRLIRPARVVVSQRVYNHAADADADAKDS